MHLLAAILILAAVPLRTDATDRQTARIGIAAQIGLSCVAGPATPLNTQALSRFQITAGRLQPDTSSAAQITDSGHIAGAALSLIPAARAANADSSSFIILPENRRSFNPTRFWVGAGAFTVANTAAMVGLYQLWYADYHRGRFHFHDDWDNWKQQDKLGHMMAAYHVARVTGQYGRWSGMSDAGAGWLGAGVSWGFQLQIEMMDGFSEGWGFSLTDLLFNTIGSAVGGLQVAHPGLNWFAFKYSYHRSDFYDPSMGLFGNTVKDYNGISYWLVIRPHRVMGESAAWWPEWLGLAMGHSGSNMKHSVPTLEFPHHRQIFLGPDLDLLKSIRWPEPWMRTVAGFLSFIRIPAPALEIGPDVRWHWLYY